RGGDKLARIPDQDPGPEAALEQSEREAALLRAIAELPDDRRIVVVLRDLEGLSYEEIAGALDLELGTVRSRLHRARMDLNDKLEGFLTGRAIRPVNGSASGWTKRCHSMITPRSPRISPSAPSARANLIVSPARSGSCTRSADPERPQASSTACFNRPARLPRIIGCSSGSSFRSASRSLRRRPPSS